MSSARPLHRPVAEAILSSVKRPHHLLLLALVALGLACAPEGSRGHGGRGVLVIAVDGLRFDHLGAAGYDRDTTPTLDALLERGIWFEETFSAAPELIASHAALLTGSDPRMARQPLPQDHGFLAQSVQWRIAEDSPSLAVEFLAAGFATAAFVDHPWLASQLGFDRGFETYDAFRAGSAVDPEDLGAYGIGRSFYHWLSGLDRDADWFAYLDVNELERMSLQAGSRWDTFFEPRAELDDMPPTVRGNRAFFAIPSSLGAPPGLTVGEHEARYDGALRHLDGKLRRLFAQLEARGCLERTTICLVGTYGMGFGESGLYLDHGTLSDVDLAVPWLLVPAETLDSARGVRAPHLASTTDVMPTLLDLYGLQLPTGMHGRSQLGSLDAGAPAAREFAYSSGGFSAGFAVHDERYSFQLTTPAVRGDKILAASWYGKPDVPLGASRMHLRDRRSGSPPGDLYPSATSAERGLVLRDAGREWFEWIDRARDALHNPPWLQDPLSDEEWSELRRRGLIPSELP